MNEDERRSSREDQRSGTDMRDASKSAPEDHGNFLTYATTQLDSFEEREFGAVDSLVLSWLAYYHLPDEVPGFSTWEGADVRELLRAECFDSMFGSSWDPKGSRELIFAVASNSRYRAMRICGYRSEFDSAAEKQFAAMTFRLPDGSAYVAYRGTDSTIVGWKEDFNMAFQCPVPSQEEARSYLEQAAGHIGGPLFVGGHSKGGNLAVYAAIQCPHALQDRIVRAFSHDGPGFNERFLRGAGYERMRDRIDKTLPRSSVFGMIFEDQEDYAIVESTGFSLLQHNPFSWVVEDANFREVERITAGARYLDSTLAGWMGQIAPEERGRLIDALFELIKATDAERFADIRDDWPTMIPKIAQAAARLDPKTRSFITSTLGALAKCATIGKIANTATQVKDTVIDLLPGDSSASGEEPNAEDRTVREQLAGA